MAERGKKALLTHELALPPHAVFGNFIILIIIAGLNTDSKNIPEFFNVLSFQQNSLKLFENPKFFLRFFQLFT